MIFFVAVTKIPPEKPRASPGKEYGDDRELLEEVQNLLNANKDDSLLEDTAIAIYAYYISTAGQSIFKKDFLDEYKS